VASSPGSPQLAIPQVAFPDVVPSESRTPADIEQSLCEFTCSVVAPDNALPRLLQLQKSGTTGLLKQCSVSAMHSSSHLGVETGVRFQFFTTDDEHGR